MNTEKAERLRAIADWIAKKGSPDFPTPTITNYIGFLLSLADEESKPLELSDEEIKAQTDSLYYILSDSERALYTDAAEWYRSRVRVDLERFGVALLDWYFRDLKRENISTAVEHNTLKFFLQSPEFEKWSKETLKS